MRSAAFLASAAIMAGCGGSDGSSDKIPLSQDDYQSAMLAANEEAHEATQLWGQMVIQERPPSECERLILRFHSAVNSGVEMAAAVQPPSEIADIHARFVAAAKASVAEVARVADRVESGEVRCGRDLNEALYGMPSTKEAEDALAEIEQAGIPLGRQ